MGPGLPVLTPAPLLPVTAPDVPLPPGTGYGAVPLALWWRWLNGPGRPVPAV